MYDYVIVGGGSAGCVLAARLSEMRDVRVLLLEAGPGDDNRYIHWPVGFAKMTAGPFTWGLTTAPQRHANDRQIPFAQARVPPDRLYTCLKPSEAATRAAASLRTPAAHTNTTPS